jgi:3-carboxy-cis,cis-muconate cycloisomerase
MSGMGIGNLATTTKSLNSKADVRAVLVVARPIAFRGTLLAMSAMATFDPGFTTPAMTEVWSAESRIRRMLDVEVALGAVMTPEHAEAIATACDDVASTVDAGALLTDGWSEGTPVLPLLALVRAHLSEDAASALHRGATSQDIIDTATMLQIDDSRRLLSDAVADVVIALDRFDFANDGATVMARTLLQPALPIALSHRVGEWQRPLASAAERLYNMPLPIQMGGPVGDMRDLDGALIAEMADDLGLVAPGASWHTDRTPLIDAVMAAQRAAAAAAKVASDLAHLAQPELGEIRLRGGGSSSMANKRNPIDAIRAIAAADACNALVSSLINAPLHEFERAAGAWHLEWFVVPMIWHTASAAVAATLATVESAELITSL